MIRVDNRLPLLPPSSPCLTFPNVVWRCRGAEDRPAAGSQENEEEEGEVGGEIKGDLRFGKRFRFAVEQMLILLVVRGLRVNQSEFSKLEEEGKRRKGKNFLSRMEKVFFFLLAGEKNAGSDDESRKRRARGERDGIGAMTARPVLRFSSASERASERALVSREFDRYSGINS